MCYTKSGFTHHPLKTEISSPHVGTMLLKLQGRVNAGTMIT